MKLRCEVAGDKQRFESFLLREPLNGSAALPVACLILVIREAVLGSRGWESNAWAGLG